MRSGDRCQIWGQNIAAVNTAPPKLSRREREVARLVAEGLTSREIGAKLFISERTAEGHVEQIRNKLGFRTRAQVAAWVAAQDAAPATPRAAVVPTPPAPEVATSARRSLSRPAQAPRWIWLSGGVIGMLALGIVIVTVLIPALSRTPPGPRIDTFGGTGLDSVSPDGNPARSTSLSGPNGIVVSATGEVYFADGYRIRKVDRNGLVQTVAGTGVPGFAGDGGPPLRSQLKLACFGTPEVVGLAIDANGVIFFSDPCNDRVRKIVPDGVISTVAGGGTPKTGGVGDGGRGVDALLNDPRGLALDGLGDLFIADTGDNRVRKLDTTGIISTVAGDGMLGWSGDGGPANLAELSAPEAVVLKGDDLYISDAGNERIRRVSSESGVISTVVGDGSSGFSGDGGPAIKAKLSLPLGLAIDGRGNLYVSDSGNDRVRKIDLAGVITTVAGNGHAGFSGDGKPATSAMLNLPVTIAFGNAGEMYIADGQNNRIRVVRFGQE